MADVRLEPVEEAADLFGQSPAVVEEGVAEERGQQEDAELYHAACEHFGTWKTALRYAGVANRRSKRQAIRQPRHKRLISVASEADPAAVMRTPSPCRACHLSGFALCQVEAILSRFRCSGSDLHSITPFSD